MPQDRDIPLQRRARAPYNFVPLPPQALPAPAIPPDAGVYWEDRLTGEVNLTIRALTPLFVGHKTGRVDYDPGFFQPPGRPETIPGSTLRGMTRTLVEIVSAGKLQWTSDRRLYSRAVGDTTRIGHEYRERLTATSTPPGQGSRNEYAYTGLAGWMYKRGSGYVIRPAPVVASVGSAIFRVDVADARVKVNEGTTYGLGFDSDPWTLTDVYFWPASVAVHRHHNGQLRLHYARVEYILPANTPPADVTDWARGTLVRPGKMQNWHFLWLVPHPADDQDIGNQSSDLSISREDQADYVADLDRIDAVSDTDSAGKHLSVLGQGFSVLPDSEWADGKRTRLPCFYTHWKDSQGTARIAFGHTGMFRLPIKRLIDAVPEAMRTTDGPDLAEAIFGTAADDNGGWASRVFFEDAACTEAGLPVARAPRRTLMGPKPTAVQHYAEQPSAVSERLHTWWDGATRVQGHKLYWHRSITTPTDCSVPVQTQNQDLNPEISPLGEAAVFTGRVRFENLSAIELGALLFALDLPSQLAHKVGMGKSLGLGSVRITCGLHLRSRAERYSTLFDDGAWHTPAGGQESPKNLKNAFAEWMLPFESGSERPHLNANPAWLRLWQSPRIKELASLLNHKSRPPNWATAAMPDPNQVRWDPVVQPGDPLYRDRPVLPAPSEVLSGNRYEQAVKSALGANAGAAGRWSICWMPAGQKGERAMILAENPAAFTAQVNAAIRNSLGLQPGYPVIVTRRATIQDTIAAHLVSVLGGSPVTVRRQDGAASSVAMAAVGTQQRSSEAQQRGNLHLLAAMLGLRQINITVT